MSLIVQKFGGTSVATSEHIKRVAARIATARRRGHGVIAVVSAMGSMTDELADLASQVSPQPPAREMDMLLTAGERISMALLAMALDVESVEAMSLTGSQAGILTMGEHGSAEIQEVRSFRVQEGLDQGMVVIVAGFQGVDPNSKDVTTLGRGGSDVTAVALAAAHSADLCEIYKDVDGVFTADPALVADARLLTEVSYDEMAALAAGGSRVLMGNAVDAARRFEVPVHIRSSFREDEGTWVRPSVTSGRLVCGVAHDADASRIALRGVLQDRLDVLIGAMSEVGLVPDMLVETSQRDGTVDVSFVVAESRAKVAEELATATSPDVLIETQPGLGRLSVVGDRIPDHPEIERRARNALEQQAIPIIASAVAPNRLCWLTEGSDLAVAVSAVHTALSPPTTEAGP